MASTYLSRVAQHDAISFDIEVIEIFKKQLTEATKHVSPGLLSKYEPEINLFLKLLVFKYSLVKNNATFGQQLLAIKYSNFTPSKLYWYAFLTHGVSYLKDRIRFMASYNSDNDRKRLFLRIIDRVEALFLIAGLVNFLIFLRTGLKPSLIDRILSLNQVSVSRSNRMNVSYSYMSREILWHSFIELLVFALPLINYHSLMRKLRNVNPWYNIQRMGSLKKVRKFTLETKCPACNERPILPHHMGCSHLFCYYCLQGNLDADTNYECPSCGFSGKQCTKFYM